jgi:hypothetical protein
MEQSINLAHKDCLVQAYNIGSTVVHNICDGTSRTIPYGSLDWMALVAGGLFARAVIIMFTALGALMIKDFLSS